MSWQTVAICDEHWRDEEGDRVPVRLRTDAPGYEPEPCYRCGTSSNIFVRRDVGSS